MDKQLKIDYNQNFGFVTNVTMANSRTSGDILEGLLCEVFESLQIECKTPDKRDKIYEKKKNVATNLQQEVKTEIKNTIEKIITPDEGKNYHLTKDNDGKKGITSDIKIFDSSNANIISISCKRNNHSLKHQRPSALPKHLQLSDELTSKYKDEYKTITQHFYKDCNVNQIALFKDCDPENKTKLYKDVNELVATYLSKATYEQKLAYIKYLLSMNDENLYILHYSDRTKKANLYKYNTANTPNAVNTANAAKTANSTKTSSDEPQSIDVSTKDNNYIVIKWNNLTIQMRLHNASSRITKSVSLKYDTTILNFNEAFTNQ